MKNITAIVLTILAIIAIPAAKAADIKASLEAKLSEAVARGNLAEAKLAAETLLAVEARETLALQRRAMGGLENIRKASPAMIRVAQFWARLEGAEKDPEAKLFFWGILPALQQVVSTGTFDEATVTGAIKSSYEAKEARRREWETRRRQMEEQRRSRR